MNGNISVRATGATLEFDGTTKVYDAAKAAAWADLDLSGTIGARQCNVLLKVVNKTGAGAVIQFRKNGETTAIGANGITASGTVANNSMVYVLVTTDAAGILEWYSSGAAGTVELYLEAYEYA